MEIQLSDVLDRLSILTLKAERIGTDVAVDELRALIKDVVFKLGFDPFDRQEFSMAMKPSTRNKVKLVKGSFDRLYEVNGKIWDLEADIRQGKEGKLGLEEVGRRALAIRNLNNKRVAIKNEIVSMTGKGFKDVKKNHASA